MGLGKKYMDEYRRMGSLGKTIHNSLYVLSFAISLYPLGAYDAYYRKYVKSQVNQSIQIPSDINAEGMAGLALAGISTLSPSISTSRFNVSIPIHEVCESVSCQIGVALCTSSAENLKACTGLLVPIMMK